MNTTKLEVTRIPAETLKLFRVGDFLVHIYNDGLLSVEFGREADASINYHVKGYDTEHRPLVIGKDEFIGRVVFTRTDDQILRDDGRIDFTVNTYIAVRAARKAPLAGHRWKPLPEKSVLISSVVAAAKEAVRALEDELTPVGLLSELILQSIHDTERTVEEALATATRRQKEAEDILKKAQEKASELMSWVGDGRKRAGQNALHAECLRQRLAELKKEAR
jgi:hypothetical protein